MTTQFLKIDFEDIDNGHVLASQPGPLAYYLLLRRHIWRSPRRPGFPYAPPAHSAYQQGLVVAVLADKKAAEKLGVSKRTIQRYRDELLRKGWILSVKPTMVRQVRMWWLGWWEKEMEASGEARYIEHFFWDQGKLRDYLSTYSTDMEVADKPDLSPENGHLAGQDCPPERATDLSVDNIEHGLNSEPSRNSQRFPDAFASGDGGGMSIAISDEELTAYLRNVQAEVEDGDYGKQAVSRLARWRFPRSELCKKVFAIRRQQFFGSSSDYRSWLEIEYLVEKGILLDEWVLDAASISADPSGLPDGMSYSGRYPGTTSELMCYIMDPAAYGRWLDKKGYHSGYARSLQECFHYRGLDDDID